jgi:hypothetical protein
MSNLQEEDDRKITKRETDVLWEANEENPC